MPIRLVSAFDRRSIAAQAVEKMFSTAEGWLGVDDPVLSAELPEEMVEDKVTSATGARGARCTIETSSF
jgi:hypothetical protein